MLQRSLVAMGISGHPEVLIADEPTKGIDIMNKQAITYLLRVLRDEGITLIIITHDLQFAKNLADRIAVMYSGRIVEIRGRQEFFLMGHCILIPEGYFVRSLKTVFTLYHP